MSETLVKRIMLDEFKNVQKFIAATREEDDEVMVRCGKYIVDGKSIMGIFSLDLTQPLIVEFTNPAFADKLKAFEVY